jgi:hypothetical protein
MSDLKSLPPVSPGIVYAVRRLVEHAPTSDSEARQLCTWFWPRMDADAIETVLVYWKIQKASQSPDTRSVPLVKVAKMA